MQQLALDHLPFSIFWKDLTSRIVGVNKTLLEADLAEDLPIIEGRLGPLNQVWLNMIVGAGISKENVDRIFDRFITTKPVGKGTGQGLAIAHQVIVAEHKGAITVNSTLGVGTTST